MTLLLLPFYLLIVFFVIRWILKQIEGRRKRWLMFLFLAFLFYLPLGWDVILGRAYFHYLCATQGGVHVYQTVELGPEYWNPDGSPKFITEDGWFDDDVFEGRYKFEREDNRNFNTTLNIGKYPDRVVDLKTGEVLGEKVSYVYFGGWFFKHTGFNVRGVRCHGYSRGAGSGAYRDILSSIFLRNL